MVDSANVSLKSLLTQDLLLQKAFMIITKAVFEVLLYSTRQGQPWKNESTSLISTVQKGVTLTKIILDSNEGGGLHFIDEVHGG